MKKTISVLTMMLMVLGLWAQQRAPFMSFRETVHDFGKVKQEMKRVSYMFEFVNTGGKPIIINEVKSSCPMITTNWVRKPIPPGGKGAITVELQLADRPGTFQKTIQVYSNAKNSPVTLTVKGVVEEKLNPLVEQYPVRLGEGIRAKTKYLSFGKLFNDETKTQTLEILNNSQKPVKISIDGRFVPQYLSFEVEPETLEPGKTGKIIITFDGNKCNDWDYVRSHFYVTADGKRLIKSPIFVSAVVKERFTEEQLKNPPIMTMEESTYDFGKIKQGDVVEHEFKFKNTGKSDLYIRKTHASCGCTAVSTSPGPIPPGGEGVIKARFNSAHKAGRQVKAITIITNSPKTNKVVVKMTGYIEVPEANTQNNKK